MRWPCIAVVIGTIELVGVLHDAAGWTDPITTAVASISLDQVGYVIAALFIATWAIALIYWRHSFRHGPHTRPS